VTVTTRVQVVGTQRSGSNMLRLMLAQLGVFAPPSTHLIDDFRPMLAGYAPLHSANNLSRLVHDVLAMIDVNVLTWPAGPPTGAEVLARCQHDRTMSLGSVLRAVYDAGAAAAGSTIWACKDLENLHHSDLITAAVPQIHVVHLLRDPRDVALSFAQAPIGPKDPRTIGLSWAADQIVAGRWRRQVPAGRWHELRYERLIATPGRELRRLCDRLGLRYHATALEFHRRQDAIHAPGLSTLWTNLDRPVMTDNSGRFHRVEHRGFVTQVEESAFETMRRHGYQPTFVDRQRTYDTDELARINAEDQRLRRATRDGRDPVTERRHRRRDDLLRRLRAGRLG